MTEAIETKRISFTDLLAESDAHRATIKHGKAWGHWTLDAKRLCLVFNEDGPCPYEGDPGTFAGYEVDLEEITTAAELCDWIYQIHKHGYDVSSFIDATNDLLHPQGTLCSFGKNTQKLDAKEYLKRTGVLKEAA